MSERVKNLLKKMTIKEKIGQLYQAPYFSDVVTGHKKDTSGTLKRIKEGMVGSILSVHDESVLFDLQKIAIEESRLGIPILFAFDVIHGYHTSFPINLALSNSWDTSLIEKVSKVVAYETAHKGIHLTFSPMLDIVRDPRWGRVMESNGEDPYLSGVLGQAYIKGYQQDNLSNENTIASCAKHFIGYGLSEAGREYNTVDLSDRALHNIYLPPFKMAVEEGVPMVMTSFNTVFDVPSTANKYLLKNILRDKLKFDGVIISDYTSTEEIISHKIASNLKEVAYKCFDAGLEMEMVSESYIKHLQDLIENQELSEKDLDRSVERILDLKEKLGLFDNPYGYFYENSDQYVLTEDHRRLSKEAAEKSIVLLKNDDILPINDKQSIVLCGPFSDSQDLIGEWKALSKTSDVITIKDAFMDSKYTIFDENKDEDIRKADCIIMALGEAGNQAGEGNSKTDLNISKEQEDYFDKIYALNQNIVLIIFAGRPLILTKFDRLAKAILYAYQPGLEAGPAIRDLIMGHINPSAKLTMTFPYHQGQIPIYYNHYQTGRPFDPSKPDYRYNSRYIDSPNDPLYVFGHGLSYSNFKYENLELSQSSLKGDESLKVSIDIFNDSDYPGDEIVQLYIEALSFSVSRPVNELKAFKKVTFKAHERKTIDFELDINDFKSYNIDMIYTAEKSYYYVKVGRSSSDLLSKKILVNDLK
jgi:beta-glucosidase